jgi:hypothetical protein
MLHILQWLYVYVASVFLKCFSCLVWMSYVAVVIHACILHVYFPNVSSVSDICCKMFYLNVAYVTVVIHICCKRMFNCLTLFQDVATGDAPHAL